MKKLDFKKQAIIGMVMGISCFLIATTKITILHNIGWIIWGLLFIINPLVPESVENNQAISEHKKRWAARIAGIICVIIGLITKFGV